MMIEIATIPVSMAPLNIRTLDIEWCLPPSNQRSAPGSPVIQTIEPSIDFDFESSLARAWSLHELTHRLRFNKYSQFGMTEMDARRPSPEPMKEAYEQYMEEMRNEAETPSPSPEPEAVRYRHIAAPPTPPRTSSEDSTMSDDNCRNSHYREFQIRITDDSKPMDYVLTPPSSDEMTSFRHSPVSWSSSTQRSINAQSIPYIKNSPKTVISNRVTKRKPAASGTRKRRFGQKDGPTRNTHRMATRSKTNTLRNERASGG